MSETSDQDATKSGSPGKVVTARKFMFLRVGARQFAIPLASVREVLALGQLTDLPNMPPYFAGLINLRGKIVSTVHLHRSLKIVLKEAQKQKVKRPCVIITEVEERLFGAIVDDVVEVAAISAAQIDHPAGEKVAEDGVVGIVNREGAELAPILNLKIALRINELMNFSK